MLSKSHFFTTFDDRQLIIVTRDLSPSIQDSEEFRTKMSQFPPITSGKHRETKSFAAIMDETVGFMD